MNTATATVTAETVTDEQRTSRSASCSSQGDRSMRPPFESEADRRLFDDARAKQGFRSQAHLDAFFAAYDHTLSCDACKALDGFVLLDDGYQSTSGRCAAARQLDAETTRAK